MSSIVASPITTNVTASAYAVDVGTHGADCPHCQAISNNRLERESAVHAHSAGTGARDSGPGETVDRVQLSAAALEASEGMKLVSKPSPDPGGRRATLIDVYA